MHDVVAWPLCCPAEQSLDAGFPGKGMAIGEVASCSCGSSQRKGLMAEGRPMALPATGTTSPLLRGISEGLTVSTSW